MSNKDKFLKLVSEEDSSTLVDVKERIKSRSMLRESQHIAIKVLIKLEELDWSQKDLARELNVSPQQVTKIVNGKENLTIDTQIKLQNILNIPILASFYEKKMNGMEEWIVTIEKHVERIIAQTNQVTAIYQEAKIIKMKRPAYPQEYYQLAV